MLHIVQRMNNSNAEVNAPSETDIDSMLDQLDAMMLKLGRVMSSSKGGPLARLGVNPPQYMLLRAISHQGASRVCDAAEFLGVGNPAASMLIKSLEAKGFVARQQDSEDRRVTRVDITDSGGEIVDSGEIIRRAALRKYTTGLDITEMETFMRVLATFMDAVALDHQ
jgi:DNA-binding MarR family transcriptional regulator